MNQELPDRTGNRYSAKRLLHVVDFFCRAPRAQNVSLVGDFNNWSPAVHRMERAADGCWRLQVELHHGHHQYVFLVDGKPMLDPQAQGKVRRPQGQSQPPYENVSLMAVS
jgi:1,4-alpha-glucan branching enzyme